MASYRPLQDSLHLLFCFCVATTFVACTPISPAPSVEPERTAARQAISQAEESDARLYAEATYAAALSLLDQAEQLLSLNQHEQALPLFAQATELARQAKEQAQDHLQRQKEELRTDEAAPPEQIKSPELPPPRPKLTKVPHYIVTHSESLWSIAQRPEVYDDPLLWPLIYQANRDQIKDPKQVHTGQVLMIPRNISESERDEARAKARKSEIFPVRP